MNYTSSQNQLNWGATYARDGEIGCLRYEKDRGYQWVDGLGYEEVINFANACWDTVGVCSEDIPIENDDDGDTLIFKQSYNSATRSSSGGGI